MLVKVYCITNKKAEELNQYLDLHRCSDGGNRLLYINSYTGAGADSICNKNNITLLAEDATVLTCDFYLVPLSKG